MCSVVVHDTHIRHEAGGRSFETLHHARVLGQSAGRQSGPRAQDTLARDPVYRSFEPLMTRWNVESSTSAATRHICMRDRNISKYSIT